jgi:hypothetical protein
MTTNDSLDSTSTDYTNASISTAPAASSDGTDGHSSKRSKFVAVGNENLPDGFVGRGVFWTPNGAVPYQQVADALEAAGFGDDEMALLPSRPSPMVALRRAMDSVSHTHTANGELGYYVSPLSVGGKGKQNKAGWLIAQRKSDGEATAGASAATVDLVCHTEFVDEEGVKQMRFTFDPEDHPYRDEIEAKYAYYLSHLVGDDISYFLTQSVARSKLFGLVPFRPSGGFYYVAPAVVPVWQLFTETFTPVSGVSFYHVDMINTAASFIEAALAGIGAELGKRIDQLSVELEKGPGMRKLNNATKEIAEMLSVAAGHEAVLGGVLSDMREKADRLGSALRQMIAAQEAARIAASDAAEDAQ